MSRFKLALYSVLSVLMLLWVTVYDVFLPIQLTVGYESPPPKGLVAYLDTGTGFNEAQTLQLSWSRFRAYKRSSSIYFGPPIQRLRLDLGPRPRIISITSLCLDSLIQARCWDGVELAQRLIPNDNITSVKLVGSVLQIARTGPDPFLVFDDSFHGGYLEHARIKKSVAVPAALLLPGLIIWFGTLGLRGLRRKLANLLHGDVYFTSWQGVAVTVLAGVFATGCWLSLDNAGVSVWVLLLCLLIFLAFYPQRNQDAVCLRRIFANIESDGSAALLVTTLAACTPIFLVLGLNWDQEFPYLGDQQYHLDIDRVAYAFIRDHVSELCFVIASFTLCLLAGWMRFWILAMGAFFLLWSYTGDAPQHLIRYPNAGRFLAAPFFYFAETQHWDSLLNAARLANTSSVVIWLFVLRPLFVRRWPDWCILPVVAAFFFQTEVIYYFSSAYLEPWALILVLLAVEYQLRLDRRSRRFIVPLCLIGCAAIVKEAAIFLLPLFWLIARPWRFGLKHFFETCFTAVAAAAPFLIYFILRSQAGQRPFAFVGWGNVVSGEKLIEIYYQLDSHFGWMGLILLSTLCLLLAFKLVRPTGYRYPAILLAVGTLLYLLYINIESTSITYAGYTRYLLFPYLLLCCGLLLVDSDARRSKSYPRLVLIVAAAAISLNAQAMISYVQKSMDSDSARNFTEHYDAPAFMPIRSLVEKAEISAVLEPGQELLVNNPLGWAMPSVGINYPGIARRYNLRVEKGLSCICEIENRAILHPFIHFAGLNSHLRVPSVRRRYQRFPKQPFYQLWSDHNQSKQACFAEMQASCRSVFSQFFDGDLIGILGVL